MANHPAASCAPNCIFIELDISRLPRDARAALPVRAAGDSGAAGAEALPDWCIGLLAAAPLEAGDEVLVDYHLRDEVARRPSWYTPVAAERALGWP